MDFNYRDGKLKVSPTEFDRDLTYDILDYLIYSLVKYRALRYPEDADLEDEYDYVERQLKGMLEKDFQLLCKNGEFNIVVRRRPEYEEGVKE